MLRILSVNTSGFTLIEVMIAITILSFISFSTYKMIDSNTDTKDRVIKEDRQNVQSLTAIGRLDSDISQIYNPLFSHSKIAPSQTSANTPYSDSSSSVNGAFDGRTNNGSLIPQFKSEDKSTIIFLTSSNRRKFSDSKESRLSWVKYSLRNMEADPDDPDDSTSGLYKLVRQSLSTNIYQTEIDWSKPKPQVIMERIKELEFSFWDEKTKKYTTSLQDLNENKNLIRSIKLKVTWVDNDKNEQKIEKTFRVLNPFFNTKLDELKTGGAYGGGAVPPNLPDPTAPASTVGGDDNGADDEI